MAMVIRTAMHTAPAMATLPTVMDMAPTTVIPRTVMDTVLGMPTDHTILDTATLTTVIDTHIRTTAPRMDTIVRGVGAVGGNL